MRGEESFLRDAAKIGDDELAAIAFDLAICQRHGILPTPRSAPRALLDDVLLDRLDGHAGRPQPCEPALDLVVGALEFDRDQAHILRHAGAADIKNQVELLDQLVKDGLPDEGFWVAQVVTFADTFHLRTRRWRCSRRHSCHPIQRLVERYFSPKSEKIVTT